MPSHTIKEREKKRHRIRRKAGVFPGGETSKRGIANRLKRRTPAKRKTKARKRRRRGDEVRTGIR